MFSLPAISAAKPLPGLAVAPGIIGAVELDNLGFVPPVWRPLLSALAAVVPVRRCNPAVVDAAWFSGEVTRDRLPIAAVPESVCCADPHAEAVEALRWARDLLSSGRARPEDIAITAAATSVWDDHFLALSESAELPLHFSHGVPALSLRPGQACAALADALVGGLSQDRIRRLFAHAVGVAPALRTLPRDWASGLPSGAGLFEAGKKRLAGDTARAATSDEVRDLRRGRARNCSNMAFSARAEASRLLLCHCP